jgi:hypothetical protein
MRWGLTTIGALALVGGFIPSAHAATRAVSQPSFTSASYVQGDELPVSLLVGSWQSNSTISNRLTIVGAPLTGAKSTADATWLSSWGWTRPGKRAISLVVDVQHKPLLPGLAASSWQYQLDERVEGGPWFGIGAVVPQPYDPIMVAQWQVHNWISSSKREYVQFRVHFHADINSTTFESMTVQPHLLTRTAASGARG